MRIISTSIICACLGLIGVTTANASVATENYPDRPVQLVVNSPPGGSADALARLLAERLARSMNQAVVVESRAGGGGTIGAATVSRAKPDGYTILLTSDNFLVNLALLEKPNYAFDDFVPVVELTRGPSVLVAGPTADFPDFAQLLGKAKAEPGAVLYGSGGGIGYPSHIAMELLQRGANVKLTHVPYRGAGPALIDLMGGQIPLASVSLTAAMPMIRDQKLKALAVTSPKRWPSLPDTPSVGESVEGYVHWTWLGIVAPKGTPQQIVARLNHELNSIIKDPELEKLFRDQGSEPVGGSADAFGGVLKDSFDTAVLLVREGGLKAN